MSTNMERSLREALSDPRRRAVVDRIRVELWRFECQQTQLLLDGVLPCDGAGAVMLGATAMAGGWCATIRSAGGVAWGVAA